MEEFDLLTHSLEPGTTLIEASAGTGKTYNIQHIYLRFVVEKNLQPADILVVTFSEAATNELKERISSNLLKVNNILSGLCQEDTVAYFDEIPEADLSLVAILRKGFLEYGAEELQRRVGFALCGFDEAAISTIHSFCLKILQDHAFESRMPYGIEIVENKDELFRELVADFVRQTAMIGSDFDAYIFRSVYTERWFLKIVEEVYGKDDIEYLSPAGDSSFEGLYLTLIQEYDRAWRKYSRRNKRLDELFDIIEENLPPDFCVCERVYRLLKGLEISGRYFTEEFTEKFQRSFLLISSYEGLVRQKYSVMFFDYLIARHAKAMKSSDRQQLSFDDFLYLTRRAIHNRDSRLIKAVQQEYSAVLVDEFQDTSSVQFDIFNSLFGGGVLPFFMIGDPKQSIYGFRGADIFSYLEAVNAHGVMQRTLSRNFRSTPELLADFNLLYDSAESDNKDPFIYSDIEYVRVSAGRDDSRRLQLPEDRTSLEFWWNYFSEHDLSKEEALARGLDSVVGDIVKKLRQSAAGDAYYREDDSRHEKLLPRDFAVLVNDNRQAMLVRDRLVLRGVPAVILKSGNIFSSREALQLLNVLNGILKSGNDGLVMAALSCDMFAYSLTELQSIYNNSGHVWEYWLEFFSTLREVWKNSGIFVMLNRLFYAEHGVLERQSCNLNVVECSDAQRALTNYAHLFELFARQEEDYKFSPEQLIREFEKNVVSSDDASENEMRLESDSEAVKVITIHKSKGLQFRIVYVPFFFMQDFSRNYNIKNNPCVSKICGIEKRIIFFSENELLRYKDEFDRQGLAELMRLFYVALTRAIDKCVVLGGRVRGIEKSGLHVLLGENFERIDEWGENGRISVVREWEHFQGDHEERSDSAELKFVPFTRRVGREWGVMSYSSLVSHEFERIDVRRDSIEAGVAELFGNDLYAVTAAESYDAVKINDNLASLPSSNKVGSAVHEILEETDFSDIAGSVDNGIILEKLRKFGVVSRIAADQAFAGEVEAVRRMLEILSRLELQDYHKRKFTLSMISPENICSEMSFYFPVRKEILLERFSAFLQTRGLYSYRDNDEFAAVLENLGISFQRKGFREGFMYGLIDLVFEYEGKFYFADWKTNNLQSYGGYDRRAVLASMNDSGYLLQFYIYTVALVLFLRDRITGFSSEEYFGGGYYLYLRGLDSGDSSQGVFYETVAEYDIRELLEIFTGGDADDR